MTGIGSCEVRNWPNAETCRYIGTYAGVLRECGAPNGYITNHNGAALDLRGMPESRHAHWWYSDYLPEQAHLRAESDANMQRIVDRWQSFWREETRKKRERLAHPEALVRLWKNYTRGDEPSCPGCMMGTRPISQPSDAQWTYFALVGVDGGALCAEHGEQYYESRARTGVKITVWPRVMVD